GGARATDAGGARATDAGGARATDAGRAGTANASGARAADAGRAGTANASGACAADSSRAGTPNAGGACAADALSAHRIAGQKESVRDGLCASEIHKIANSWQRPVGVKCLVDVDRQTTDLNSTNLADSGNNTRNEKLRCTGGINGRRSDNALYLRLSFR